MRAHMLQFFQEMVFLPAQQAAVQFNLLFTLAALLDTPFLARQVRPLAYQAGQVILDLGQLNLQPALACAGALTEDDQDERGTIKHPRLKFALQCTMLPWRQLQIENDSIAAVKVYQVRNLLNFARAKQCSGMWPRQALDDAINTRNTGRCGALSPLVERFLHGPAIAWHVYANQDSAFGCLGK